MLTAYLHTGPTNHHRHDEEQANARQIRPQQRDTDFHRCRSTGRRDSRRSAEAAARLEDPARIRYDTHADLLPPAIT